VIYKKGEKMDNSAKPETEDNTGEMRMCPFMSNPVQLNNVDFKVPCIQHKCMAWQCLGDFREGMERTQHRQYGCKLIEGIR